MHHELKLKAPEKSLNSRDQTEKQPERKDAHRKPPRVLGAALDG
jgi:hypothetical protein